MVSYRSFMDKFDRILQKLEKIEERLNIVEDKKPAVTTSVKAEDISEHNLIVDGKLFEAINILQDYDEISDTELGKKLGIDDQRTRKIVDQLEKSGYIAPLR